MCHLEQTTSPFCASVFLVCKTGNIYPPKRGLSRDLCLANVYREMPQVKDGSQSLERILQTGIRSIVYLHGVVCYELQGCRLFNHCGHMQPMTLLLCWCGARSQETAGCVPSSSPDLHYDLGSSCSFPAPRFSTSTPCQPLQKTNAI